MKYFTKALIFIIAAILSCTPVFAQGGTEEGLDTLLKQYASKRDLTDWEAISLGINGVSIKTPLFTTPYFKGLEKEVTEKNGEYRLVTDYARLVLVYKSHDKDPTNIAGYDFIQKIIQFENLQNQGLNAYIWALTALYGQDFAITHPLIENVLAYQASSGGFCFSLASAAKPDGKADIDLTAMTVMALAPYTGEEAIRNAVDRAVAYLSAVQSANGAYVVNNEENVETLAQVIIALSAAGIDINDTRFVKNGHHLTEAMQRFLLTDGNYAHTEKGKSDPIATRQAVLALSALRQAAQFNTLSEETRKANGIKRGIFEMTVQAP